MQKRTIQEAIVVEGRDDIDAVSKAYDALMIATHGFGIRKETWELIEKAYNEKGIIVLTDPDFSGEEIRRRITARFPDAKQAFIPRDAATRDGDIGVENATPEAIIEAIEKAHVTVSEGAKEDEVTMQDLTELGLTGDPNAAARREAVGAALGIGYGNGKAFLRKLKAFGIGRTKLTETVKELG